MEYLTLGVLCCTWCVMHSGMISLSFEKWIRKRLKRKYKFYRLFYNLIALGTFLPLLQYKVYLKGPALFSWEGEWSFLQISLYCIAGVLFIAGAASYDLFQFFGISQIISGESHSTLSSGGQMKTSGILSVTRHPWYLGGLILVWILYTELDIASLLVNTIFSFYLVIGTFLEERKLVIKLGKQYKAYQKEVSMLFPIKWFTSKLKF